MTRKILTLLFSILSVAGYSQSTLTNNAIINLKDLRSSAVWKVHYLSNADSLYTLDSTGLQFIKAARFKPGTTAQRPAFALPGMIRYNTDSSALEFYDGATWQKLSIAAGVSTPGWQSVLTANSTLTTNNTVTTGSNTFSINTNSGVRFHTNASGNVGINGTTTSGYDLHVNGLFGATSGAAGLYFNGTTNLTYAVGSGNATWRIQGDSRYFNHVVSSGGYLFFPATDNAREYKIQEVGGGNIFGIDFANKLVKMHAVPAATANDGRILMRGSSDSAERQLMPGSNGQVLTISGGIPTWAAGSSYTFTNGLTNTSGTVSLGGAFPNSLTQITGGGSSSQLIIGGGSGLASTTIDAGTTQIIGAFATTGTHTITSGTSATVNNDVSRVVINPGSVLASYTLTLSATPVDGEEIQIFFGGTIAGGATVVTALTISANTGQTLMQPTTPSTAVGGDCIIYKYLSSNTTWYRVK